MSRLLPKADTGRTSCHSRKADVRDTMTLRDHGCRNPAWKQRFGLGRTVSRSRIAISAAISYCRAPALRHEEQAYG